MTVAQRLKHARTEKGWNQAQLAVAADISQGTIGNIESGARQSKGSLPQIAKALGINHDWLANGIGEMRSDAKKFEAVEPRPAPVASQSPQAVLLASLFDKIEGDEVWRAQIFNKASQIIINAIQGPGSKQRQEPSPHKLAKKQV